MDPLKRKRNDIRGELVEENVYIRNTSAVNHSGNSDVDVDVNVNVETNAIAYAFACYLLVAGIIDDRQFGKMIKNFRHLMDEDREAARREKRRDRDRRRRTSSSVREVVEENDSRNAKVFDFPGR
ncbi:hypothetical protein [Fictibacillus gelatini]|uniref:hypothetical protein n=1 Tax=Fictibacillus gelatini TaxID=225985 RepID=UPI0003F8A50B|nr:hypothetical protein [Fictibacillus gelatini]